MFIYSGIVKKGEEEVAILHVRHTVGNIDVCLKGAINTKTEKNPDILKPCQRRLCISMLTS